MNKVVPPDVNDHSILNVLARNRRLRSHPLIQNESDVIKQGYRKYKKAYGNALTIPKINVTSTLEEHLLKHYKSPPKELNYINEMRADSSKTCPMCGSFHCGTIDHILPKEEYPIYAIFSLNLVPACLCNNKRNDALLGNTPNERILHPYFDDCLQERLIRADFCDLGDVPKIDLALCIDNTHPEYEAINFHVRSVVRKSGIIQRFCKQWSKLIKKPASIIRALEFISCNHIADLRDMLLNEQNHHDTDNESKNNWDSAFITGLLEPDVMRWLFKNLNRKGRKYNDPLIDLEIA